MMIDAYMCTYTYTYTHEYIYIYIDQFSYKCVNSHSNCHTSKLSNNYAKYI